MAFYDRSACAIIPAQPDRCKAVQWFGEGVESYKLGVLALFVEEMRIWGEIEGLDRALYFYGAIFHSCEWYTISFFSSSRGLMK
jgi:hypothetical protein